jgi:acetoin utilization protein AcuB
MIVQELMTAEPASVRLDTPISRAWEVLRDLDVRHLPVVNQDRELVGILSDRDLAVAPLPPLETELLGPDRHRLDQPVSTIMSADVLAVEVEDDVTEAIDLMVENKVGAVPVVDPERHVVGIISYLDVLRSLGRSLESE